MKIFIVKAFPTRWAIGWALLIGAIHFLPQAIHLWHARAPGVLLEENLDEVSYAVWASRAAGEHPGQPDPYQITSTESSPVSFGTAQPVPAWAIGSLARVTRWSVPVIFLLGSFIWPAITAFFFIGIAWLGGIKEPWSLALCAVFSLLMLPPILWLMQWRYTTALLSNIDPGFRLTLPYSRRYQPQFTAVIHYACLFFSLLLLHLTDRRFRKIAALAAGVAFGLSFYCYYFSWTLLLGWFVLGSLVVYRWHRASLTAWIAALLIGLTVAIPYFVLLARHFVDISASAAAARVYTLPTDPAIYSTLLVCLLLACAMLIERGRSFDWWIPLTLNLVAVLGAVQNVITGIYIQPYHYLHYFARPATNLALCMLWIWAIGHWLRHERIAKLTRYINQAFIALCLCVAVIFQIARYRDVATLAQEAVAAQPAMQALRNNVAPGAVVYCLELTAREAIPLYTNAIPFFSRQMLLNESPRTQAAMQARIAAWQWLSGKKLEEFSQWVLTKPVDVFFQHLQLPPNDQTQAQISAVTESLIRQFAKWEYEPEVMTIQSIRYALLQKQTALSDTRLSQYFNPQLLWSDEHYALYWLELR